MHRFLLLSLLLIGNALAAPAALTPPTAETLREAGALLESMKRSERGPSSRIRWFCKDGSSQPPVAYACVERGGGRQHAEYSAQRQRLAALGWHVGTVFAALDWDEFWRPEQRNQRLRELPLERFMEAVDDGWVLRRARDYRGRVQLEDEEAAGRLLLLKLLEQSGFLADNFLLARELARTMPHGGPGEDRTRTIRHLAQEIAEQDASFSRLRIEGHSRPSAATSERVRAWLGGRAGKVEGVREKAGRLADGLDELYGLPGRKKRLNTAADALAKHSPEATGLIREAQNGTTAERINRLSRAMEHLRKDAGEKTPTANLRRLELLTELDAELRTSALERLSSPIARQELMSLSRDLLRAAWGLGLLSAGEWEALEGPIEALLHTEWADAADYAFATRRLSLAAAWAAQTVRFSFAEPLLRYAALDPRAGRFVDDLLRDSVLLPLGEIAHQLAVDGAAVAGINHRMFGRPASGLLGLNPGVARGRLRILEPDELAKGVSVADDEIAVLTETVADLNPVAGVLTLGEGNPLSHVQMLARNLGIPNVAVAPDLLAQLRAHAGDHVLLAVAGDGRVLLEVADDKNVGRGAESRRVSMVSAPQPDLSHRHPIPLAKLQAAMSGKVVGPKAANIGELSRMFPDRIAPAVALPFGIFAEHTASPRQRLEQAFHQHRAGRLDQAGLDAELDAVRASVAGLSLKPSLVTELSRVMTQEFGPGEGYGLFVRSDTNAEDLPDFTGAGLNRTVPHVVGLERQLAAVVEVWSSVYSRRAMAWRSRILDNPEAVFASVLLMKSIPSEKSGVLVTADLVTGGEGLTVSVAWGAGGAVDNESAASRVLRPDGTSLLVAEAKAPYRRVLAPAGGVVWQPAAAGPVLDDVETAALRQLAGQAVERYPAVRDGDGNPLPWDIEFAFAGGKLWLLQIRPLIQRGRAEADAVVNPRIPVGQATMRRVPLDRLPGTAIGGKK